MSKVIGQRLKWKFPQGLYRHPGFIFSDGSPVSKRFQIVAVPFMASLGVNDRVSIQDVFFSVQALEELQIGDDLPCIGANSLPLQCRSSFDTNFEDRSAFITGCSKFIEEATKHAEFDELLREGFAHAANLYTWRCCSRAVPMPRSNDQPNRAEINDKIMQVLEPEVRKLDNFMQFTLTTVDRFCGEFRLLCHPEKRNDFVSESLLLLLGKLLNMFLVLDALKDMKASTKNDLSTFRRASQFASHNSHTLSLFLANQNSIKQLLRKEIQKLISMAKSVQSLMSNMDTDFSVAIRQHIYAELQDFVGGPLRDLLGKAVKHKKDIMTGIISAITETCSDSSANGGMDHHPLNKLNSRSSDLSSTKLMGGKKSKKGIDTGSMPDLRSRRWSVVPSSTQEAVQRGYEAAMDELQTVGIDATYARFDMCMPPHFVRADCPSYTAAVVAAILSLSMQRRVRADSAVTLGMSAAPAEFEELATYIRRSLVR